MASGQRQTWTGESDPWALGARGAMAQPQSFGSKWRLSGGGGETPAERRLYVLGFHEAGARSQCSGFTKRQRRPSAGLLVSVGRPGMLEGLSETFTSRPLPLPETKPRKDQGKMEERGELTSRRGSAAGVLLVLLSHFHDVRHLGRRYVGHGGIFPFRG